MKVLVMGATGGSGRAVVAALLLAGHEVTAFARSNTLELSHERLRKVQGDVMRATDVTGAVRGHDAVVVTLGIREYPLRVRLRGPAHTALDVRSRGTRHVMQAMRAQGVKRLVVQTSFGVGDTRDRLRFVDRLFFKLLLAPQIADTEVQNREVEESELEWVLAQPVHLTDAPDDRAPFVSTAGDTAAFEVSRRSVGRFLAEAVSSPAFVRKSVAISGAPR